jgi:hypothetical protein
MVTSHWSATGERRFGRQSVTSGGPQSTDIARPVSLVRFVPTPNLNKRWCRDTDGAADSDRVNVFHWNPGHEMIPPPDEAIFIATRRHPETNAEYKQRARVISEFLSTR